MKIWCISDTHTKHGFLDIPEGIDMILHAGDVAITKEPVMNSAQVLDFLEWFKCMPAKYKIFTPGNHDTSIERGYLKGYDFGDIIMLNHQSVEIEGIKIFGSPYTPSFGVGWAYNVSRHKLADTWADIPNDTDVLITHGPPQGILDLTQEGIEAGCKSLYNKVIEVNPKLHLFGHIHEKGGWTSTMPKVKTKFINGCVLNLLYNQVSNGIIIDL